MTDWSKETNINRTDDSGHRSQSPSARQTTLELSWWVLDDEKPWGGGGSAGVLLWKVCRDFEELRGKSDLEFLSEECRGSDGRSSAWFEGVAVTRKVNSSTRLKV